LEDRELNQARSKPDTINRPVRTARICVHHYNSTQYRDSSYLYSPSSRPWPGTDNRVLGWIYTQWLSHSTCLSDCSFSVAGPHLWNSLPDGLRHLNLSSRQF